MSRTIRAKRPRSFWLFLDGNTEKTVRDGTQQLSAGSCSNNGRCSYCRDNRLHRHKRAAPLVEGLAGRLHAQVLFESAALDAIHLGSAKEVIEFEPVDDLRLDACVEPLHRSLDFDIFEG